jgi:hypothetical protein
MIRIPMNDMMIPAMFIADILSLIIYHAAIGVNNGIVDMMTALIEALEYFKPKFSPRK